jgi:NAD(P)-dependent dehydrogenase (short-subunit alcohol dehydrogenase family)
MRQTPESLSGCVAVVTGAASGQGRATAVRLAREGALIAALDVDPAGLASLQDECERDGTTTCLPIEVDVSSATAVQAAFAQSQEALGPAYILAAAAAIYPPPRDVIDMTPEQIARIFDVNVFGIFNCVREAARQMVDADRGGRIVLWSSLGARRAIAGYGPYCSTKGAVEGLARALAAELGPAGVAVNVIAPGAVDTPMIAGEDLAREAALLPARRIGQPEDVAELAAYLCSSHVGFMTGTVIDIDGGSGAINGMAARADPE